MKTLKDLMAEDVGAVFLNPDEFAEYHSLNGKRTLCQIDRNLTTQADVNLEGIFINAITIYVSTDDMTKPKEGALLRVDGSMHIVRSVSEEGGVFVIVAEASEK